MHPGELLDGVFEIVAFFRAGGMGEVFRARDKRTGAEVALKLVKVGEAVSPHRFEREVAVLAELRHPGIVRYVGHGIAPDGRRYLAMEWLEGEDLAERLRSGSLTIEEGVALALCLARALPAAPP